MRAVWRVEMGLVVFGVVGRVVWCDVDLFDGGERY